ncbi:MAG: sensor histidine kinase [Streptomyces sp.]|nr:sensor histidine kinase [Streptomyces sp.]
MCRLRALRHTEPVSISEPVEKAPKGRASAGAARVRAALAGLLRPAPLPRDGSQSLSRWAWAADAITAVVLSAATAYAAATGGTGDGPFRSGSKVVRETAGGALIPIVPPLPPAPPAPRVPDWAGPIDPGAVYFTHVTPPPSIGLVLLAALTALPLAARRRWPLGSFLAVFSTMLTFHALLPRPWEMHGVDDPRIFTFVSTLIAAYAAAIYSPYRRRMVISLALGGVLLVIARDRAVPTLSPAFIPFVLLLPLGLAADTVHTWRQRLRSMEAEQEAATRLAVDRERARIARELHDVVTHNVSMMTVQAGAARTVLDKEPEQARQALLAVESAGRAAMAELRHVMGLLSMTTSGPEGSDDLADDPTADLAPQPGISQVGVLAERVRSTGVPVDLTVTGSPVPLPAGVDLAAYRVAQEALTNTVKHAAGARVTISVDYGPGEVRVEVADSGGTSSPTAATGNGRGLMGLRERLAVYGGTLEAGRRITGGYRVRAVIPVGDA